MNNYADMVRYGRGADEVKNLAVKYYSKAIEEGNVPAMYNYACMLLAGEGIDKNKKLAISYFKMASDHGHEKAKEEYEKFTKSVWCNIF